MDRTEVINILRNEQTCVKAADACDRDCGSCPLVKPTEDILEAYETAIRMLESPSVQPEIIRCNACKHWTQTTGNMRGFGLGDCDYHNAKLVNCNGYCYWAEVRNVENN